MAMENVTTIVGNLTDDPELVYTAQGTAVASLRVAVSRRVRNQESGEWESKTDGYFTVKAWRALAEHVTESLHRGDRVVIVGRLTARTYEDSEGSKRTAWEIEASEVCPSLRWATAEIAGARKQDQEEAASGGVDPASLTERDIPL